MSSGCTRGLTLGYAQSTETAKGHGYAHVYGGFGGDEWTLTGGVRGRFSQEAGGVATAGGWHARAELDDGIAPYFHLGMDTFDFGWQRDEFVFGMFSPWLEAGVRFGDKDYIQLGVVVEYDVRFTHSSEGFWMVVLGYGQYRPFKFP